MVEDVRIENDYSEKQIDKYPLTEKLIVCLHENTIPMGAKCEILHKQIMLARFVMMS